jgi:hypothetical protein
VRQRARHCLPQLRVGAQPCRGSRTSRSTAGAAFSNVYIARDCGQIINPDRLTARLRLVAFTPDQVTAAMRCAELILVGRDGCRKAHRMGKPVWRDLRGLDPRVQTWMDCWDEARSPVASTPSDDVVM